MYNLILIEGLPGTGKSTLSNQLFKLITEKGVQAELLLEENEKSPSNFFNIAGIPKADFVYLVDDTSIITETDNYVFVNLGQCIDEEANKESEDEWLTEIQVPIVRK